MQCEEFATFLLAILIQRRVRCSLVMFNLLDRDHFGDAVVAVLAAIVQIVIGWRKRRLKVFAQEVIQEWKSKAKGRGFWH